MSLTATALLLSWVAIITLGFALAGVLQRVHRVELMLTPGRATMASTDAASLIGGPAPRVPGLHLDDGRGAVLLFADRACRTCLQVLPTATSAAAAAGVPVHVLWSGPAGPVDGADADVHHHAEAGAAYEAYGVMAAPWIVVVGPEHLIVAAGAVGNQARADDLLSTLPTLEEVED